MGGNIFTPGTWRSRTYIYVAAGSTVVLDGKGDPDSEFLFQSDNYMEVGGNVKFDLINGAKWENVVWACKSYFTSGAGVEFHGSILAGDYIALGASVTVHGCLVSLAGVTLGATNTITLASTIIESATPSSSPSASPTATPSHSPTSSPTVSPTAAAMETGCDADSN
jgi:hypothetical protein